MSFRRIRALFIYSSRRKLSKCVIALFQLLAESSVMNCVQPGHVYRSEDFRFLPRVISFVFFEDSISIELNIILYSCYIILVALGRFFVRCMRRVLPSLYIIGLSYIWNLLKRSKTWNKTTTRVSGNHCQ